jgi:hypothetical protein
MAILGDYKFSILTHGRNGEPLILLTQRDEPLPNDFLTRKNEQMQFGVWYSLLQEKILL